MSKIDDPRKLLAKIRQGDFAHAGDREAIDIVMKKMMDAKFIPSQKKLYVLDVGCGLGGTADYIREHHSHDITGIDKDANAIKHATDNYPKCKFFSCSAADSNKQFPSTQFELIYLFNVFYAISEKEEVLKSLAEIAKPETMLVIFDYVNMGRDEKYHLKDLAGKEMYPVLAKPLLDFMARTGWLLLEFVDLSENFISWYKDFLDKLIHQREELLKEFSDTAYQKVHDTFSALLRDLESKQLGGGVWYAKRK